MAVIALASAPESKAMADECTQKQHAHYARAVYNHRDRTSEAAQGRLGRLRECLTSPQAKTNATRLIRRLRKARRERLSITPYRCGRARFAVPCYIIACESRFVSTADNGSHFGYYQLRKDYLGGDYSLANQHRVAAKLWNGGQGAHHWVCA